MTTHNGHDLALPETPPPPTDADAVSVAVVICAYTTERWDALCAAVDSVLRQQHPVQEIILVIDHNHDLYQQALSRFGAHRDISVVANAGACGLSAARNTGLAAATSDVVAFLDDDACADPQWSAAMVAHYRDGQVAAVGGYAAPRWPETRPSWLPEEFDWVVGCSYRGQPTEVAPVRNPLGCNMSVRRRVLTAVDGFDTAVGRIGGAATGCDETELCIRIRQRTPAAQILFDPGMRVNHIVTPDRATFRYFARRCYYEGVSKAVMSGLVGARDGLSSERAYTRRVLPRAVARGVLSHSRTGLTHAAVVIAGLGITSAGYVLGLVRETVFDRVRAVLQSGRR